MGYDDWLTRQWEARCTASDNYLRWCADHNEDPDDIDSYNRFTEAMEDAAEAHYERVAEQRAEMRAARW